MGGDDGGTTVGAPGLVVRTERVDAGCPLPQRIPVATGVAAWLRGGWGAVGWGVAARFACRGEDRFADAQRWWDEVLDRSDVDDPAGLVAFMSFAFADGPEWSRVVVPRTTLRLDERGIAWRSTVRVAGEPEVTEPAYAPVRAATGLRWLDDAASARQHRDAVAEAVHRIRGGELSKVVLARTLDAEADADIDVRLLLTGLAEAEPDCWTYCVDGLVGATPELLFGVHTGRVRSLVLAGTDFPGRFRPDSGGDALAGSAKDRGEHRLAVESVLAALRPVTAELVAAAEPALLRLATVAHLATEVRGTLRPDAPGPLAVVGALHPSAAVGGTPTARARRLIAGLEAADRGRYAGPVGLLDGTGAAEFGIALRCGQLSGHRVRLFAGCGVVAGSVPEVEAAEAAAKFGTMRAALGEQPGRRATGPARAVPAQHSSR